MSRVESAGAYRLINGSSSPFRGLLMGGFECATHRRADGRRLDLTAATEHDRLAAEDYRGLAEQGIVTARDGLRWHLIETQPGCFDWSSALPLIRAARRAGVQVIWDLCHYGYPDDLDIFSDEFVERFSRYAAAAVSMLRSEGVGAPVCCPINEMSYWAWAGGQEARINPAVLERGDEFKRQLARAWIAAVRAIGTIAPEARFISAEPAIHVVTHSQDPFERAAAEHYRCAQYEALDLVSGRLEPELGGGSNYIDIVGINFYPDNQWFHAGSTIPFGHHDYRPLADLLGEVYERYGRPLLISETGAEGSARAAWLHYICGEVRAAMAAGVPVLGLCIYPILDYPGWDNDRYCPVGLWSRPNAKGVRTIYEPLREEIDQQVARPFLPEAHAYACTGGSNGRARG